MYFGYIPDKEDVRDFPYGHAPVEIAPNVDLRPYTSPVRDQGNLGSCTAFAIGTGMKEYILIAKNMQRVVSPLWLYYRERELEGTIGQDSGAYIRDGLKVLLKKGIPLESKWKYDISKFKVKPPKSADNNADNYMIKSYQRLKNLLDIQNCLTSGRGVVIGFDVYTSFEDIGSDGIMKVPNYNTEDILGGHAVFVVGYKNNRLIVKNSWGTNWGDRGYFYMPFDVINHDVHDMWTAR